MDFGYRIPHVRTMNLHMFPNNVLRDNLKCGMNHIPLSPIRLKKVVSTMMDACVQAWGLLNLATFNMDLDTFCNWAQKHTWWILKSTKETSFF